MTKIELWLHEVKLKHISLEDTKAIADAVDDASPFKDFNTSDLRNFEGDDPWPLLNRLFDFADEHLIHIV